MATHKKAPNKKLFGRKDSKKVYINLSKKVHLNFLTDTATEATANFQYNIIPVSGVELTLLDINGSIVSPIQSSGKIYAEKSTPFYLEVRAKLTAGTGGGTIQLKDLQKNKDVFDSPQQFTFPSSSSGGLFLEDVKLP